MEKRNDDRARVKGWWPTRNKRVLAMSLNGKYRLFVSGRYYRVQQYRVGRSPWAFPGQQCKGWDDWVSIQSFPRTHNRYVEQEFLCAIAMLHRHVFADQPSGSRRYPGAGNHYRGIKTRVQLWE